MAEIMEVIRSAKRKREEKIELTKIYPNLCNRHLSYEIDCAVIQNVEKCTNAFTRCCPVHFVIHRVSFVKNRNYPVCRWHVEYIPENGDLPEQGDALKTLVELILQQTPANCVVLDRDLVEKQKVVVHYGVIECECLAPVFEDSDIKTPLYLFEKLKL